MQTATEWYPAFTSFFYEGVKNPSTSTVKSLQSDVQVLKNYEGMSSLLVKPLYSQQSQ